MSSALVDKVYIGLDNAPAAFDIKGRILGPNGTNLEYIRSETGVIAILKGDKFEPLHLTLHHTRAEALAAARSLALNLIETIRAELAQWTTAQSAPPPSMNVPPPTLTTAGTPPTNPASITIATSASHNSSTVLSPVVSVAGASPLMTVRQPTVLQLLQPQQQQQYVLNQENGQLIPIVQPGVQVSNANHFASLPIAQQLSALQQPNFGTQLVDISGVQPVNVTQLRLSGVPSSMSMILPNGITIPHANVQGGTDTTTVSSAVSAPVVCAAPSGNPSQKILYSADKSDKSDVKYHIQGADGVQWTVPGSQTMIIPYQQLQELTSNQGGLANLQPQQYVSIAPMGGLQQTSLPLTAAQLQQFQASGTIMPIQKPVSSAASFINIISTGQASSPQQLNHKNSLQSGTQENRAQKRMSDGTPSQLQLRPIAPAGSAQEKSTSRDSRSGVWTGAVRESTATSMGTKINPAHGTIIHVSSGQQTNISSPAISQEGQGMYIKQIDRNSIQLQSTKDGQKQEITTNKLQSATQNVQMIHVPQGMTVLQNPLNLGHMQTMISQPNGQVYMIPTNQHNLMQAGGLTQGLIQQQVLQPGQNVTVMQPNQLTVPNNMQYNTLMPMNMAHNTQYMQGINLNNQLTAQQINAALQSQQLNQNLTMSNIPIVQTNAQNSSLSNVPQTITVSQSGGIHQVIPQNSSYVTSNPTIQNQPLQQQYLIQPNSATIPLQPNQSLHPQYNIQQHTAPSQPANPPETTSNQTSTNTETETIANTSVANTNNQSGYISSSSQPTGYTLTPTQDVQNHSQQNYSSDSNNGTQSAPYNNTTEQNGSSQTNYSVPSSNGYSASPTPPQPYTSIASSPSPASQAAPVSSAPGYATPSAPGYVVPGAYPTQYGPGYAGPWFRGRFAPPQHYAPPVPVPAPAPNYNYWQDS